MVGEDGWWSWFDNHIDCSRALARANMGIFRQGIQGASYDDVLKMLDHESRLYDESLAPATDQRPPLPEPLAILRRAGLLDDESVAVLLAIHDDLGPEVLQYIGPEAKEAPSIEVVDVPFLLNVLRPLSQPTLWPGPQFMILPDEKLSVSPAVRSAVLEAARQFVDELFRTPRGQVLRWEAVALWYASATIMLHSVLPDPAEYTVAWILHHHLASWRESIHAALFVFRFIDMPEGGKSENTCVPASEWWGYFSDLRHAGLLDAAKAIKERHADRYPNLAAGNMRFGHDVLVRGSFALPSSRRTGLDKGEIRPIKEAETGETTGTGNDQTL